MDRYLRAVIAVIAIIFILEQIAWSMSSDQALAPSSGFAKKSSHEQDSRDNHDSFSLGDSGKYKPKYFPTRMRPLFKDFFSVRQDAKTGFVYGGVNDNATITNLSEFNGIPLDELNRTMGAKYLGAFSSLSELLIADNTLVQSYGFTHQELALPLFYALRRQPELGTNPYDPRSDRYDTRRTSTNGFEHSPLQDSLASSDDYTITNRENGTSVFFSEMVPAFIWRYGFYEGGSYRTNPLDIIRVFFPERIDLINKVQSSHAAASDPVNSESFAASL